MPKSKDECVGSLRDTPLIIALKGFCMGAADVVPGVSGGTIALITGIYARLIAAIRSFDLPLAKLALKGKWRTAWDHVDAPLLMPLGIGIAAALAFFTRVIPLPALLVKYPEPVYALFFGLIVASTLILARQTPAKNIRERLFFIYGLVVGVVTVMMVPMETPNGAWFIFLCGTIAISALLLPGLSGSFILLVLGKYAHVFDALGRLDLAVIFPFALGAITGLVLFSRVLAYLLKHYYRITMWFVIGLLSGTLYRVWPFQHQLYEEIRDKPRVVSSTPIFPETWGADELFAVAMIVIGVIIVIVIHLLARRIESTE